ncbi:cell wall protein DAN4-like isoform X3, partial [Clarias magur]
MLRCGKTTEDSVTWSRDVDGKREKILTVYGDTVTKHIADPDRRYSSGKSRILIIFKVSHSDAGQYCCNQNMVELSVIAKTETSTQSTQNSTKRVKRSCREKNICVLECGDETADSVTWSRDVDGKREKILTVYGNTVTKHIADPHRRYSSGEHLILSIFGFSHSDAGRYHCNKNTVELNVKGKTETSTQDTTRSGSSDQLPLSEDIYTIPSVSRPGSSDHEHFYESIYETPSAPQT